MTTPRSYAGEDVMLRRIFRKIGATNQFAVEFGALDGRYKSNTLYFRERGWDVRLFDVAPLDPIVMQARITAENINQVFADAGVPQEFDLLSIDIDGNDLWVWKALTYRPRVVIIEYNPRWNWRKSRTVPYDPDRFWDGTIYYGASVRALCVLAAEKGYELVDSSKSNLCFVLAGLFPKTLKPREVKRPTRIKRPDPEQRKWEIYR